MLDAIRSFVTRRISPASATPSGPHGLSGVHIAACALLLELAQADGELSEAERAHIQQALRRHFATDEGTTEELFALAAAERRDSIDHFQFTRLINEQFDLGQKMVLAEVMWGVILADGHIAEHEAYLVRKLANMLNLEPGYLTQARKSAAEGNPGRA